jgi:hypothetical protein
MKRSVAVLLLASVVILTACTQSAPLPARSSAAPPSTPTTVVVPPGKTAGEVDGIVVALRTSATPAPGNPGSGPAPLAPGNSWLTVSVTATNSTDATIDLPVFNNMPELTDAAGATLRWDAGGTGSMGAVNPPPQVAGSTQPKGPEGLRPGGSMNANLSYQVAPSNGPFTLTWRLGAQRVVQFQIP